MAGNPDVMQGPEREDLVHHQKLPVAEVNERMGPGRSSLFRQPTSFPQGLFYSPDLAGLVAECLEFQAQHRPSVDAILTRIDAFLNANPAMRGNPMLPPYAHVAADQFRIGAQLP